MLALLIESLQAKLHCMTILTLVERSLTVGGIQLVLFSPHYPSPNVACNISPKAKLSCSCVTIQFKLLYVAKRRLRMSERLPNNATWGISPQEVVTVFLSGKLDRSRRFKSPLGRRQCSNIKIFFIVQFYS